MIEQEVDMNNLTPLQEGLYKHLVEMKHNDRKAYNRLRKPLNQRFAVNILKKLK